MHELGIAKDLFAVILEQAKKSGVKKITGIKIRLGEASGIDRHMLEHSLEDHQMPGSIAEGAVLTVRKDPVRLRCRGCGHELKVKKMDTGRACTECECSEFDITAGKDVYVESIEAE